MLLRRVLAGCITIAVLAGGVSLAGQSDRATIRGAVLDGTGAAVPAVNITAEHVDTGHITRSTTDDRGRYSLLNLPVGTYTVTFEREGFASARRTHVAVGVQSALQIDMRLQLAGLKDSVTVGVAETLDSRSAATGTTLQQAVVSGLPLTITSGRSIENFAYA